VVQAPEHVIENLKLAEKKAAGKKVVMQKPPQKGYVHWDRQTFERLLERPPEPLESRFSVTHGMLLSLLQGDPKGYRRLVELIARAHTNEWGRRQHRRTAATLFRTLRRAGLIGVVIDERARHPLVEVSPELQRDFSLNHTLSIYLVDTVKLLDQASPTYALDVLSLVESILENPQVVLWAQVDRLKTEKMAEMKAAGMEFAERIEELDKVTWPKPLGDFIYDNFNAFAAKHPWVAQENIRPKSVARDLLERFCSFDDYVRDYGLQRSEGVVLRYLSQAYKALLQTVPEALRTEEVDDVLEQLRGMLRTVDSSLLDEWENLRGSGKVVVLSAAAGRGGAAGDDREQPLADNPRALGARVRGELHRLQRALAGKRWDEALAATKPGEWSADKLAAELAPYFAEHATIDVTPAARRPSQTLITPAVDKGTYTVRHKLLDPAGDEDWMIDAFVDARAVAGDTPILELRGVRR